MTGSQKDAHSKHGNETGGGTQGGRELTLVLHTSRAQSVIRLKIEFVV